MKRIVSVFLAVCMAAGLAGLLGMVPAGAADSYEPPANLDQLSQAEQLAYFNLVVNRVRGERPGFRQSKCLQIVGVRTSISGGIADAIINTIVQNLMPGGWEQRDIAAGQSNVGLFLSKNANASDLRPQDIISISIEKQGDNWAIALLVQEEINPALGLNSAHGRIAAIATREQVIAELTDVVNITVNLTDTTMRYYNGFASVTVNSKGQVISAQNGFQVDAEANGVGISVFQTDLSVTQNSEWQYSNFDWESKPTQKWYQRLLQWLLRYLCFGWLWMK